MSVLENSDTEQILGAPKVYTIRPGAPFLDILAQSVVARFGADPLEFSKLRILLPTRRSVRALREAFLRVNGRALLLPMIQPLGDVDEDAFAIASALETETPGEFDLPPAISPLRRQVLLTQLILKWGEQQGAARRAPGIPAQAAQLARALAGLLDQVQTEQVSFDDLAHLVPDDYARHWQITLEFLQIITHHWPRILAEEGLIDPAERRHRLLGQLAEHWRRTPPATPVIAAGSTGSIPATARLLDIIARLPQGAVILPGLDRHLEEESWNAVTETHPQFGMHQLLVRLGVTRDDVKNWSADGLGDETMDLSAREKLIAEALRPAGATESWRGVEAYAEEACQGLSLIEAPNPREEAGAIALCLRESLATEGARAALVTPDRDLARRVAAELRRWGIAIDDSGGVPLTNTPPATFLRVIARAASTGFAPVELLEMLKHPLTAGGRSLAAARSLARTLETAILRGPRPAPGLSGLTAALNESTARRSVPDPVRGQLLSWIEELTRILAPLTQAFGGGRLPARALLDGHLAAAEALATTADEAGAERLWSGEAGAAVAEFLTGLRDALGGELRLRGDQYPALLEEFLAGQVLRSRAGTHPRLQILGPLEARLQHVDTVILGGLNEATWPADPGADPWMSRPMKRDFGLPLQERQIGLAAHDFAQAACLPAVIMTRAQKVEGAPTVPSRWLLRLENLVADPILDGGHYLDWFRALDSPEKIESLPPPAPRPPVSVRPRQLSVTQIETWMRDPYAIYARHILHLKPLDPLDARPGAAERGTIIHVALHEFVRRYPAQLPPRALDVLLAVGKEAFANYIGHPSVRAFWWPRFCAVARWFVETEKNRRTRRQVAATEIGGRLAIAAAAAPFIVTAKADRIEQASDGTLAIIDYKTGAIPTQKNVRAGYAPQLSLEALIANKGGFQDLAAADVEAIEFWKISGGDPAGKISPVKFPVQELAANAESGLRALVDRFDKVETPYLSRPAPEIESFGVYDHLARRGEWMALNGTGEGGQ